MKRITSLVIKSLITILIGGGFATTLQAQSERAVTVRIPFQFTVGTQSIAPGTYKVSMASSPFEIAIVDVRNGHRKLFSVLPEQGRTPEPLGRLVFEKREGGRVLSEVHFPGTDTFIEVIQPRGRVRAKRSLPSDSVSVAQR